MGKKSLCGENIICKYCNSSIAKTSLKKHQESERCRRNSELASIRKESDRYLNRDDIEKETIVFELTEDSDYGERLDVGFRLLE